MNHGRRASLPLVLLALGAAWALASAVALSIGPAGVPVTAVWHALGLGAGQPDAAARAIVVDIRLPRILLAGLVGAALAQSGTVMQGLFRNPMADPYLVGVSAGAALGASVAAFLSLDFWVLGINGLGVCAFVGALLITSVVYAVSSRGGRLPVGLVLLTGVAVSSLAGAATSYLAIASGDDLHRLMFWLMGSLSSRRWDHVRLAWPQIALGMLVVHYYARDLNVILQGEEDARHLGVDVERVKRVLLVASSLLAAAAVAVSGVVGFVGLVVPHCVRLVVGPDHRRLLPASALAGALLLVVADCLARSLAAPAEVPLGVVTALLGAPFFLYLLGSRGQLLS